MNFSDTFKQSSGHCYFSPDGEYVANAVQCRLVVRNVKTMQPVHTFTCKDVIEAVRWSPDSEFIACAMFKRSISQVWSIDQPDYRCTIDEGAAGLVDIIWCPDSRHLIATAELHIRLTVWSLMNKSIYYMKCPKNCDSKGLDFSPDEKYLALAERRDCKDCISVFDCATWKLINLFEVDTQDLAGIQWSPNGRVICAWDNCLYYKAVFYTMDGHCVSSYSAYEYELGIKSVCFSSCSQLFAIGSYDEKVRLLNTLTYRYITEFNHPATVEYNDKNSDVIIFKETVEQVHGAASLAAAASAASQYEIIQSSVQIPVVKPDPNKPNPKIGISLVSFSADNRYMLTRNDSMAGVLWIWYVPKLKHVALIMHDSHVKVAVWNPVHTRLAFCTGTNKVYMWTPRGALTVQTPQESGFTVQNVRWNARGDSLLVIGKDSMTVCYISDLTEENTD